MPSRIIREGWVESETLNQLDAQSEVFFLRLCLKADDFGRYHANPVMLASQLYPLREDVKASTVKNWLGACERAGLVRTYTNDGKHCLEIVKFGQRIKPNCKSKFPAPPATAETIQPEAGLFPENPGIAGKIPPYSEAYAKAKSEADCTEPDKQASAQEPPVFVFPAVGAQKEWPLMPAKLAEYQQTFPSLDVRGQLAKALQWCRDNPTRRKTANGMAKFLFGWLERCQNRGAPMAAQPTQGLFRPASSIPDNLK